MKNKLTVQETDDDSGVILTQQPKDKKSDAESKDLKKIKPN